MARINIKNAGKYTNNGGSEYFTLKDDGDTARVRFLYDDIGCLLTLPVNYFKRLRSYGIKANCFAKFNGRANSSHNNRSHRKITIIDGLIAYTGGINLADEYINKNDRLGYWKDSIIEIRGKGVNELLKTYLFDWDLNDGNISNINDYLNNEVLVKNDGYYLPFGTGPRPIYIPNIAGNTYLNLINQAKNYVYITTPYLIIDNELSNALINAAKRGVEVIIITPHIPDKKIVYSLTKNSYMALINNGVKIYEFKPGFIHEKNFICDDLYAVCGTINFDYRSLIHHYENAIWMYKTSVIKDMKQDFLETLDVSIIQTNETAYQNGITRLFVGILKVFSPEYNGYKVYWDDGAQIVSPIADGIIAEVNKVKDYSLIRLYFYIKMICTNRTLNSVCTFYFSKF